MINILAMKRKSKFKGDNLLLEFISNHLKPIIRYNMQLSHNIFVPIKDYKIPILRHKVENADCSGVYIFVHKSGKIGIGSALSCRDRLQDHLNSFYGHRITTFLHN